MKTNPLDIAINAVLQNPYSAECLEKLRLILTEGLKG